MNHFISNGPGGSVIRHLLPAAICILVVLGFLRWEGERQGLFGQTTGIALLTAAAIALVGGLVWHFARRLDRDDGARRDVEGELRRSSRYFELSRDLTVTLSFDGYFKSVNPAVTHILGWSVEELLSRPFIDMVHADDRAATLAEVEKLADGQITFNFVNRYEARDGSYRWLDWNAIVAPDEELIYAAARDITERKAAEAALEASEGQTRQILETAHDAFISIDARGLITDCSPQAEATFGWPSEEPHGTRAGRYVADVRVDADFPRERAATEVGLSAAVALPLCVQGEVRGVIEFFSRGARYPEPELIEMMETLTALIGRFFALVGEREELRRKLERLALTDELTGLPNRRAWKQGLKREIARAERAGASLCVAIVDLDRFKGYNDRHGHPAGDDLLRDAATAWGACLRTSDLLVRLGGDEFALALPGQSLDAGLAVIERLRAAVPAGMTCSAGLAPWEPGETAYQMISRADTALYQAKQAGGDRTVLAKDVLSLPVGGI